ncbi:MAG: LacI family transcriptional regulator [Deltaproteobacteria bacterium HGW-Deltaproteobacteria-8]|nr:MAG: LacI family transcriptional regulator [Deltaproteobacteria bacterium HGW-Deltaproteobacteria-8]
MSDWQALLRQAVDASSRAAVGRELGISRTSVSLLLVDKYPAETALMAARIIERYARLDCQFTGQVPSSSPLALRQWRACRACPHNPETKEDAS